MLAALSIGWYVMRLANPLIAFILGTSLSLTSACFASWVKIAPSVTNPSPPQLPALCSWGFSFSLTSRALRFTG